MSTFLSVVFPSRALTLNKRSSAKGEVILMFVRFVQAAGLCLNYEP
jgi:hypothetical protein